MKAYLWGFCYLLMSLSPLAIALFFYWTVSEEWMVAAVTSALFWTASLWLIFFWAVKVVFPFIKTATKSIATEPGRTVAFQEVGRSMSRWVLGLGTPLVIVLLDALSLLYYPYGWIGVLITVAWVAILVNILRHYAFFKPGEHDVR